MSEDYVVRVQNLSKRYRIAHLNVGRSVANYRRLSEDMTSWIRKSISLLRNIRAKRQNSTEDFWALKEVGFDVRRGDVVGIVGRNGAGKSTLLKILSRITEPTSGRIEIDGRVASLLEVGTGFHPELSGRENIFLNGAILGMSRAEIRKKFDEIVAFAETEKFLDTPVKRYSSGMYVRLAFAVAAHLEPEILIVDEVLAVGDSEFQKKCLGKMKDAAGHGRTVLFVTHSMAAAKILCSSAVILKEGRLIVHGEINRVVDQYMSLGAGTEGERVWPDPLAAPGNDRVRLKAVRVIGGSQICGDISLDEECRIEIDYINYADQLPLAVSIHLLDRVGVEILATANFHSTNLIRDNWFGRSFTKGIFRSVCTIPANFLNEGRYSIRVAVLSNISRVEIYTDEIITFNTKETGGMRKEYAGYWLGVIRPKLAWQTEQISKGSERI